MTRLLTMRRNEGWLIGGRNGEAVGRKERRGTLSGKELWDCSLRERASRETAVRKNEAACGEERASLLISRKERRVCSLLMGRGDEFIIARKVREAGF